MASISPKIGNFVTLASADDLDGTVDGTQYLDLKGASACLIAVLNLGTAGTLGIDVIEFSRDGGTTWAAATTANIGQGHGGVRKLSDGSAVASAALEAAGIEPVTAATTLFFMRGPFGPMHIRCARGGSGASGTAWATGAPLVVAARIG